MQAMSDLSEAKKEKRDLRVIKTERALKAALSRLLSTSDYGKITVSSLAREAQVSRKTFYDHYDSIDSLLEDLVGDEVTEVVEEVMGSAREADDGRLVAELTRAIMRTVDECYEVEANVLQHVPLERALKAVRAPLSEAVAAERRRRGFANIEHPEYYLTCYLEILLGCYHQWRDEGCTEPLADVADLATRITLNGCSCAFEKGAGQPAAA